MSTTQFTVPIPGTVQLSTERFVNDDTVVTTTFVTKHSDGLVKLTITTKVNDGIGSTASIALTPQHVELLSNALRNAFGD